MIYRVEYIDNGKGKKKKLAHPVKDRKALMALRDSKKNHGLLEKARKGDAEAKAKLLQLAYNIGHVDGLLAGCKSIGSYFFYDVDCYDQAQTEAFKEVILSKKDAIGLMMLEKSVGGGWHLVCRRVPHTTILENQVRVSSELKIEMDTGAHDLQRVVYSTSGSEEDLIYLDDALFEEPMSAEECEKEYLLLKEREKKKQEQVPPGAKKSNKHYRPWEEIDEGGDTQGSGTSVTSQATSQMSQSPCVAEATERTRYIFDCCMKEAGLELRHLHVIGGRHDALKAILSVGATQLLKKSELLGVLQEKMPENWQDDNIQRLVSDFYENYTDPSKKMTIFERKVFSQSLKLGDDRTQGTDPLCSAGSAQQGQSPCALSRVFASKTPPEIPDQLPKLVKAVTMCTPKAYKATVAQAMFPPLAAYPKNLRFEYIDNQTRELRICCLIVAGTGTGKDMCTKQPLTHIIADMKQRDEVNRERLKQFIEEYNSKANNKQKPQRPTDLVIQIIKSNITYAALVQRMDEAQGAPLYVRLNELEQWDKIEGCTGRNNQFTNMKLCDDEGNDFGADRASTQSVMGSGCLHLNWNANTTTSKALRYFRYVVSDGPISRLCLATIPDSEIGGDIPLFGKYDHEYDETLKPYIENLKQATGTIDCQQAKRLAMKLKNECADFARLSQDVVFDNLSHRALVHAFRKACLLYAANGMKWEKEIEDFCRWSLFYDLYLKMKFWGDQIRQADEDIPLSKRGPQSLLDFLPPTFTVEDAKRVSQRQGCNPDRAKRMIATWKSRGYVFQISDFSFKKASIQKEEKDE